MDRECKENKENACKERKKNKEGKTN